jgi:hypothetical protein
MEQVDTNPKVAWEESSKKRGDIAAVKGKTSQHALYHAQSVKNPMAVPGAGAENDPTIVLRWLRDTLRTWHLANKQQTAGLCITDAVSALFIF